MAGSLWRTGAVLAAMGVPTAALAHGALPGTTGFTVGFAHPFQATEQALALVALGLVLGESERRLPLGLLLAGFGAGLAMAQPLAFAHETVRWVTLLLACAAGLAVALAPSVPLRVAGSAALLVGAAVGAGTDIPLGGLPWRESLPALGGATAAVLLIVLNAMAFARSRIGRGPGRRIGGSWIAAASVMLLAFYLGATQAIA